MRITLAVGCCLLLAAGQGLASGTGEDVGLADHELVKGEGRMQGTVARTGAADAGQPQLSTLAALHLQRRLLGHLQTNIGNGPQFLGLGTNELKIAIPHPGTKEAIRSSELQHLIVLPPALQRFDPQAEFAFR